MKYVDIPPTPKILGSHSTSLIFYNSNPHRHSYRHTHPSAIFSEHASNHTAPAHRNDRIQGEKPFRLAQLRIRVCFQSRNTVPRVDKAALLTW